MAGNAFNVEPDVLRTQGGVFTNLGSEFSSASKRLQQTLKGLADNDPEGGTWGGADFASTFTEIYGPIRDGLFTSLDSLGERMGDIGENLQAMAQHYGSTDDEQVVLMDQVQRPTV